VTVTVKPVVVGQPSSKPTANADVAQTNQGAAVDVDVLDNDASDVGLDRTSVALATTPGHGAATVDRTTGRVRYTPAAGFSGADTFTYTVKSTDGTASTPGTVTVQVIGTPVGSGNNGTLTGDFAATRLPAAIVAGVKFKAAASVLVRNSVQSLVTGSVVVELLLSSSTTDGPAATAIATATKRLKLKQNAAKAVKLKASQVPAGLAAGTYHVLARITAPDQAVSVVDSGKTVTVAAPFVNLAATLASPPAGLTIGKKAKLAVKLTNTGNVVAGGSVPVTFFLSADQTKDAGDPAFAVGLKPAKVKLKPNGGSKAFKFAPLVPQATPGDYFLIGVIDASALSDTDPADNTAVSTTKVTVS
jgi:hypothetical protein